VKRPVKSSTNETRLMIIFFYCVIVINVNKKLKYFEHLNMFLGGRLDYVKYDGPNRLGYTCATMDFFTIRS